MSTRAFQQQRRQVFLQADYFDVLRRHYASSAEYWNSHEHEADSHEQAKSLALASVAEDEYRLLSLKFTAGEPIEPLREALASVVDSYERYQKALGAYEDEPTMAPLGLDQLGDYERCMQLIGLCYLLHRRDLLPRIAAMTDPGYRGEDTLYEDLLSHVQTGRADLDEWYHGEPYNALVRAMYEQDQEAAARLLKQYCDAWYPAFKYIPWHDGHKRIDGTEGDYFGYWAFEAGAVALLYDIDDSAVTHMVYPKDLVAWARANQQLAGTDIDTGANDATRLRCEAGQACPRAGWWFTPARPNSRRHFAQGEVMPAVGGDYGATIWQWASKQD